MKLQNATNKNLLRVCVCTSYSVGAEPRAPRHALAIAALDPKIDVTFVECVPRGTSTEGYDPLSARANIKRATYRFAHRRLGRMRLSAEKLVRLAARALFRVGGYLHPGALNTRFLGFEKFLHGIDADVYIAHNVETLLPACRVAEKRGAIVMFDSMEFHSDMGDSQNDLDRKIVSRLEGHCLPRCTQVFSSSDEMADALVEAYRIRRPLPLYNVPSVDPSCHRCDHSGLSLYWRNSVLGCGQRGLQDALTALTTLPEDITLHLQGRLPADDGRELRQRIAKLELERRVVVHEPYNAPDAVRQAAHYCVGLCLEHGGIRNHELTVSNKIFDYLMGGLAVVASDLPGLRGVIERSHGGVLFKPGSVEDLARKIMFLYENRPMMKQFALSGREFALREGNREAEMEKFAAAFTATCGVRLKSVTHS